MAQTTRRCYRSNSQQRSVWKFKTRRLLRGHLTFRDYYNWYAHLLGVSYSWHNGRQESIEPVLDSGGGGRIPYQGLSTTAPAAPKLPTKFQPPPFLPPKASFPPLFPPMIPFNPVPLHVPRRIQNLDVPSTHHSNVE